MDPELAASLDAIRADLSALRATMDRWLPLLESYFDPDENGPRGYFVRRKLARLNGG